MAQRISRAARVGRNRDQVLAAARRVFLARGYERATLDAIADEAGFSKGVVYSQFESKGDLFLALLEQRIAERAAQNEAIAKRHTGAEGIAAILRAAREDSDQGRDWRLLLLEFRLHAARDRELNRRYTEAHQRTIAGVAATLERILGDSREEFVESPRHLASLVLAFELGLLLEHTADPRSLPQTVAERAFVRLIGLREAER
jgi:AcrR family transcriptional regulator